MAILIVDDSEDIRLMVSTYLQGAGYTDLLEAASADEAFKILGVGDCTPPDDETEKLVQGSNIDLIMMDVAMPGTDGIEGCRRIKACERLHDIPVIMVSSMKETKLLDIALDSGAHDYIGKPFNRVELLARVRSALRFKSEIDQRKKNQQDLVRMTEALKKANERLEELSFIDGLTGIANRRYFDDYFDEELKRANRDYTFLSIIMIDIDHFKLFNDTYGHLKGDECLHRVANTLKGVLRRPADMAARYGGEEFAVVLPETDEEGAANVAERLRENVESLGIEHSTSETGSKVTISLGLTTMNPGSSHTPEELIKDADEALYRAKEGGRNRAEAALRQEKNI